MIRATAKGGRSVISSASKSTYLVESFRAPTGIFPAGGNRPNYKISVGKSANKKLRTIILYIPIDEDFSVFGYIGFFFLNVLFNIRIVSRLMLRKAISYFS